MQTPLPIRPKETHFLFDDHLIDSHEMVTRRWMSADICPEPVLKPEKPWESPVLSLFGSVIKTAEDDYRMFYTSWVPGTMDKGLTRVCLATSPDGLRWERAIGPGGAMGGWPETNVVLAPPVYCDGPTVIYEGENASDSYRMLAFLNDKSQPLWGPGCGLHAYGSRDGRSWTPSSSTRVLKAGDRVNLVSERIDGRYVAYTRAWDMVGTRRIYRTVSENFLEWSEPQMILAPDLADEADVEFYGMTSFSRHGWHIGLLEVWRSAVDCLEIQLIVSRDGINWQRSSRLPFIAGVHAWNRAWNTTASSAPLVKNEQMVFYFGGRSVAHGFGSARQDGVIGCAVLGTDRFCAIEGRRGGWLLTKPLCWEGGDLVLNADTRSSVHPHPGYYDGAIEVEVFLPDGTPLDGWSGKDRARFDGNTHCRGQIANQNVVWPEGRSLAGLRGQHLRLKFTMRNARLFTIGSGQG